MTVQISLIGEYFYKMLYAKNGALAIFSALFSSISVTEAFSAFQGFDKAHILLPLTVEAVFIFLFMLFTSVDMITGIYAAKRVNKQRSNPLPKVVQSFKLWRTGWKFFSVTMVTVALTFLALVAELAGSSWMYTAFLWVTVWFWVIVIGFEWKSIGENIERASGDKPAIFKFWDRLLNVLQVAGLRRVSKTIAGEDVDIEEPTEEVVKYTRDEQKV
jgi:hypothetical protein|nr:MAG TPA: holin [Caudoviricetes sp.]DAV67712.1 MAG TPA: holin [Caudoviricetes sp.]